MATPLSPRSSRQLPQSELKSNDAAVKEQSPNPSPALSAYSYTSSASSDSDFDLNSLSLDDWGIPSHKRNAPPTSTDRSRETYLHTGAGQSGTATPTAGSGSSSGDFERYMKGKDASADAIDKDDQALEEEELENEPDGFDVEDEDEEDMHANGVPAARGWRLDVRKSQTAAFRAQVLSMLSSQLEIDSWSEATVDRRLLPLQAENVHLKRISGAFSNAVFFVSYKNEIKDAVGPKTLLLRVYGSGTEVLLSRRAELLILHTLSSLYEIGPHILGTFANGRVETFFDAEPIGKDGVRDLGDRREMMMEDGSLLVRGTEGRAQWVARRMRQLHEVPLETMRTVLEQGDLRTSSDGSSVFGRGIENHLFARSHRPRTQRGSSFVPPIIDPSRSIRESPAPMAEESDTSLLASGADGAQAVAMSIRGFSPHRNNSVASFDSLATSYNSQDSSSIASKSSENLLMSPNIGPTQSAASSYADSVGAARNLRTIATPPNMPSHRRTSSHRLSIGANQPYPGMWRRSKRWAREAGKVLALVDEFCKTDQGQAACERALKGTALEGEKLSPFGTFDTPRIKSQELGTTVFSLRNTLLAIASLDFPRLLAEMDAFKKFIRKWERTNGSSRRVLAHGDTQYSNLLLIKEGAMVEDKAGKGMPRERSRDILKGEDMQSSMTNSKSMVDPSKYRFRARRMAPYERLIVIDFEYCSPNPRAYDIANAFHEWRFDYHHPTDSWSPYILPYPTRDERRRWLRAYVEQGRLLRMRGKAPKAVLDSPVGSSATSPSAQPLPTPPALPTEDLKLPPAVLPSENGSEPTPTKARPGNKTSRSTGRPGSRGSLSGASTASPASGTALAGMPSPSLQATMGAEASPMLSGRTSLAYLEASMEREIDRLEREVEIFSPACHASWALWGVTFAKEGIEALLRSALEGDTDGGAPTDTNVPIEAGSAESFDNLRYALGRVELFRAEIKALGVEVS